MSKQKKLIIKLKRRLKDFTWNELNSLLGSFGYDEITQGKTSGSRRRFIHKKYVSILLHKPHPGNELKVYQVDQILSLLNQEHLI